MNVAPILVRIAQTGEIIGNFALDGPSPDDCPSKVQFPAPNIYGGPVPTAGILPILEYYATFQTPPRALIPQDSQLLFSGKLAARVKFLEFARAGVVLVSAVCQDVQCESETIQVWDTEAKALLAQYPETNYVYDHAVSPDGLTLAIAGRNGIRILSLDNGQVLREFEGQDTQVEFSPDGKGIIGNTGYMRDIDTGLSTEVFTHEQATIALMPGGNTILVSSRSETSTSVLDLETGRLTPFQVFVNGGDKMLVSPDAKTVVAEKAGGIWGESLTTGNLMFRLNSEDIYTPMHRRNDLQAISPDGSIVATSVWADMYVGDEFEQSILRFWDMRSGELIRTIPARVTSLAFSPDGKTVAWGTFHGLVYFWDANEIRQEP